MICKQFNGKTVRKIQLDDCELRVEFEDGAVMLLEAEGSGLVRLLIYEEKEEYVQETRRVRKCLGES